MLTLLFERRAIQMVVRESGILNLQVVIYLVSLLGELLCDV